MAAAVIHAAVAGEKVQYDETQRLNFPRRFRRWVARYARTITWTAVSFGLIFLGFYYLWVLYQFMVFLVIVSPFMFWTIFGVNTAAIVLLGIIFYRVSIVELPPEQQF